MRVVVYSGGSFDILHGNHLKMIQYCRAIAGPDGMVIIGVNTDDELETRGKHPIVPFEERIELIRALRDVDMAMPQHNQNQIEHCKNLNVTDVVVGDDWAGREEFEELRRAGIRVWYTPRGFGVSSSSRKKEIAEQYEELLNKRAEL